MTSIIVIIVDPKGHKINITIPNDKTIFDLKKEYCSTDPTLNISNCQFKFDGEPLTDEKAKLNDVGIGNGDQVQTNLRSLGGKLIFYYKLNKIIKVDKLNKSFMNFNIKY